MSIKIGIIGAGGMADAHIAGFLSAGAEIAAVTSRSSASAEKLSIKHNIPSVYGNAAEMLEGADQLDAVSIITPNSFHRDYAVQALEAGLNVFCEKPPALNYRQTLEMKQAAESTGKILMFNFNNRARPEVSAMMEYIRNGTVGRINSIQALWIRRTGIPGFGGWFTSKALSGGGPVIDLLHAADLAMYFMDFPEPAYILAGTYNDFAEDRSFKGPWGMPDNENGINDVETASHAFITFKSGQTMFLRNSWAEMNRNELCSIGFQGQKAGGKVERFFNDEGIDDTADDSCVLYTHENGRPVNREIMFRQDISMGRGANAANFVKALRGEELPLNTPEQACLLMKIVDGLYESAAAGKPFKF